MRRNEKSWRYWWTMPLLIAAGIIGPGLAAPEAGADSLNDRFIAVIESEGITGVTDRDAIVAAKAVCQLLNAGYTPGEVEQEVYYQTDLYAYHAEFLVAAAESVYCPQHLTNQGVV
ncbi:NKF protein [Mycobacterium phage Seagreen]|uniref:NKF protein n=1 Tax=Mycobacterium phage Seagreen TaxID=1698713 RepID=UPI0006BCE41C|nr:NKF protein [Mycobacterium phage Seagreen]ALA48699.1 NKF protein [Mycobacterium phage Seagreen]